MAAYDEKSRYAKLMPFVKKDRRGRSVQVTPAAPPRNDALLGIHVLREGERLDHLAAKYLANPAGFWKIAEMNDAMHPEQISERREIDIPRKES
jgi:hypothetical protein